MDNITENVLQDSSDNTPENITDNTPDIKAGKKIDKKKVLKEILGWGMSLAIAFILAIIINNTLIANAIVVSSSMESTIMTDSRIICSRVAYVLYKPERFDIILFWPPDEITTVPFVKRIIGLPNEKVEIIDGKVYINDSDVPLDDSFIKETARGDFGPFYVPEDSYFVMGDNRNDSFDSKNWVTKYVSIDKIMGKVFVEYYPTPKFID